MAKLPTNREKTVKNIEKPKKNHQKFRKTSKNVEKPVKSRQKYRKTVKYEKKTGNKP